MSGLGINYKFCPYCARPLSIRFEEEKQRKYCQSCNWTYYPTESIAPVGILERDRKVLLVQRNREPHKGKWMLPSGFKDFGERTLEALYREMLEEIDVRVTGTEFVEELRSAEDPRNIGTMVPFYNVGWRGKPRNNEPEENMAIDWFDLKYLPPIAWKTHEKVLRALCLLKKSKI